MIKQEAVKSFRLECMPDIRAQEHGTPDYALRGYLWSIFTDSLCKEGLISLQQYESWDCPDLCCSPDETQMKRERKIRMIAHIMQS